MANLSSGLEQLAATGGKGAATISAGANAATGAKAAAAAKTTFLSTAAGKAVLGTACLIGTAILATGGYFFVKKMKKEEPDTTSTEVSSAVIETGESTEIATDTESMATEATEEITATEEMTTIEEASTEAVTEQSTTVAELHDIPVAELPEQEAWYSFMYNFECGLDDYGNGYDCETLLDGTCDLFQMLLGNRKSIDSSVYDVLQGIYSFDGGGGDPIDPRGYLNDKSRGWSWYYSATVEGTKWVALNILNVPEEDYDRLSVGFERDSCYIEDGRYFSIMMGLGWESPVYEIKSVKTDGVYYYVIYEVRPQEDWVANEAEMKERTHTYEAKMELKEFDGKKYWSIYSFHLVE